MLDGFDRIIYMNNIQILMDFSILFLYRIHSTKDLIYTFRFSVIPRNTKNRIRASEFPTTSYLTAAADYLLHDTDTK